MASKELEEKLIEWRETRDYPEIDLDKYVAFYNVYPLFVFAPYTIKEKIRIPIGKIYGDNWAFQSKRDRGSYPYSNKLDSLFKGYTGRKSYIYKKNSVPPVPVAKILDNYYLEEGNHRLYISKLLNRKTIIADVIEYDYKYLLKNSHLELFWDIPHIVFKNKAYQINDELKENYTKLKNAHKQKPRR